MNPDGEWRRMGLSSPTYERRFDTTVGHVVPRGEEWVGLLDGIVVGAFESVAAAQNAVDARWFECRRARRRRRGSA